MSQILWWIVYSEKNGTIILVVKVFWVNTNKLYKEEEDAVEYS